MQKVSLLLPILLAVFSFSLSAQSSEPAQDQPMAFETTTIDYGTIEQGSDPTRIFRFTNKGEEPIIITSAKGSCGCTVPTYPKEPILPGETGEIKVNYDTNRMGPFTKTVTLTSNVADRTVLIIKGKVVAKSSDSSGLPNKAKNGFNG